MAYREKISKWLDTVWWRWIGRHQLTVTLRDRVHNNTRIGGRSLWLDWLELNVGSSGWNWRMVDHGNAITIGFRRRRDWAAARTTREWSR